MLLTKATKLGVMQNVQKSSSSSGILGFQHVQRGRSLRNIGLSLPSYGTTDPALSCSCLVCVCFCSDGAVGFRVAPASRFVQVQVQAIPWIDEYVVLIGCAMLYTLRKAQGRDCKIDLTSASHGFSCQALTLRWKPL